ncbi:TlpA disulfide reductase family protein [Marinobacter sp. TBZ242]|uniref:TlpA disulfide reductase family protein n=1 Tax=Marinobacter azerbaijanicus TaxID=3050455 RepID=A0ABT7IJ90_9GAMM|nr:MULTISPECIES: TlpA disulfide reductase family protein [Gammaproteobacteria]MDL0433738.1 TlpA disulfide reductase family protein [Marinobacter sp. TBZ242]
MNSINQSLAIGPVGMSLNLLLLFLAVAIALLVGGIMGRRHRTAIGDQLINVLLIALIVARIVFVVRYFEHYSSPLGMLDIRDGGFDILGGLIAGLGYVAWRLWRSPNLRTPLLGALTAGGITWMLTVGSLMLLEEKARPLPKTPLWTIEGNPTVLDEFAKREGTPMVINLWATWCPPCRREMPVLEAAQQEEDDIAFVFVNQGEDKQLIEQFLIAESLELENVMLDPSTALGEETGSMAMPTTFFYDAQGQLVDTHLGELSSATLKRGLEKLR